MSVFPKVYDANELNTDHIFICIMDYFTNYVYGNNICKICKIEVYFSEINNKWYYIKDLKKNKIYDEYIPSCSEIIMTKALE